MNLKRLEHVQLKPILGPALPAAPKIGQLPVAQVREPASPGAWDRGNAA